MDKVTNLEGQTFHVGQRVRHTGEGWSGEVTRIRGAQSLVMLCVLPDCIEEVQSGRWRLAPNVAERTGRSDYCRARDHGLSMGNWEPEPEVLDGIECRWFALCENPATQTEPHPILGDVPICERCADKVARLS